MSQVSLNTAGAGQLTNMLFGMPANGAAGKAGADAQQAGEVPVSLAALLQSVGASQAGISKSTLDSLMKLLAQAKAGGQGVGKIEDVDGGDLANAALASGQLPADMSPGLFAQILFAAQQSSGDIVLMGDGATDGDAGLAIGSIDSLVSMTNGASVAAMGDSSFATDLAGLIGPASDGQGGNLLMPELATDALDATPSILNQLNQALQQAVAQEQASGAGEAPATAEAPVVEGVLAQAASAGNPAVPVTQPVTENPAAVKSIEVGGSEQLPPVQPVGVDRPMMSSGQSVDQGASTTGDQPAAAQGAAEAPPTVTPLPAPVAGVVQVDATATSGEQVQAVQGDYSAPTPTAVETPSAEPADPPAVGQIAEGLQFSARQEGRDITVRLDPPELGQVRVSLRSRGGEVRGVIEAGRPETLAQLQREIPLLITRLADIGINVQRMETTLSGNGQGNANGQSAAEMYADAQQDPWGLAGGRAGPPSQQDMTSVAVANDGESEQTVAAPFVRAGDGQVDIWI